MAAAAADAAADAAAVAEGGGASAGEKAVCITWRGDGEIEENGAVTMMGGMDGMVEAGGLEWCKVDEGVFARR